MPTATGPLAGRWTRSRKCTGIYAGAMLMSLMLICPVLRYDPAFRADKLSSPALSWIENVLRLIKMWLRAPIEERDADGTRRMSGGEHARHAARRRRKSTASQHLHEPVPEALAFDRMRRHVLRSTSSPMPTTSLSSAAVARRRH